MRTFLLVALVALIVLGSAARDRSRSRRRDRIIPPEPQSESNEETIDNSDSCPDFETWKERYGKIYRDAREQSLRKRVYEINKEKILRDGQSWQGCNQFTDMTQMEFLARYGDTIDVDHSGTNEPPFFTDVGPIVKSDWSNQMSDAREQGACSSSWAHAAINLAEVANGRKGYSPQSILDCSYSSTCGHGSIYDSLSYIAQNGVSQLSTYPFTGYQGRCQHNAPTESLQKYTVGHTYNPDASSKDLYKYYKRCMKFARSLEFSPYNVMTYSWIFMQFAGHLIDHVETHDDTFHRVLLTVTMVGYDPETQEFKVKTPLGPKFGERGFVRMKWGAAAQLGLCDKAYWLL